MFGRYPDTDMYIIRLIKVFVVPAFEFKRMMHVETKEDVLIGLINGDISSFHPNKKGHVPTNTTRWMFARNPYYVYWQPWYEPYVIARKSSANFAWFDERFTGK
jgi:glycosyltransferase-like protein LARGE